MADYSFPFLVILAIVASMGVILMKRNARRGYVDISSSGRVPSGRFTPRKYASAAEIAQKHIPQSKRASSPYSGYGREEPKDKKMDRLFKQERSARQEVDLAEITSKYKRGNRKIEQPDFVDASGPDDANSASAMFPGQQKDSVFNPAFGQPINPQSAQSTTQNLFERTMGYFSSPAPQQAQTQPLSQPTPPQEQKKKRDDDWQPMGFFSGA